MKENVKAKSAAGNEREIAIIGELSLPTEPPPWELQLVLPRLAKLLIPRQEAKLERSADAGPS